MAHRFHVYVVVSVGPVFYLLYDCVINGISFSLTAANRVPMFDAINSKTHEKQ